MSNIHGFAFLRTEHQINGDTAATSGAIPQYNYDESQQQQQQQPPSNKTDGEKIYDVIEFLKFHRTKGCLNPSIIQKSINVDLSEGGHDENVRKAMRTNPKIRMEEIPDPENPSLTIYTFGYQTKYKNVRNKVGLLEQINRSKHGVLRKDLEDAYEEAKEDLKSLVTSGDILAVANTEGKDQVLFPRGEPFLVELDGIVDFRYGTGETTRGNIADSKPPPTTSAAEIIPSSNATADEIIANAIKKAQLAEHQQQLAQQQQPPPKPYLVNMDVDPTNQIKRGEAVWVGGQWFRVSSAVKEGVPLDEQPERAKAPPSVTNQTHLSRKNISEGYIRPFNKDHLPLDHDLIPDAMGHMRAAKLARKELQKMAVGGSRGIGGSAISTLLSCHASADNPETLAKAVASSGHHAGGNRRRPTASAQLGRNITSNNSQGGAGSRKVAAERIEQLRKSASNPALIYNRVRRHGCTVDVRNMYLSTNSAVPTQDPDGVAIHRLMVKYKLLEPNEPVRRTPTEKVRTNLGADGKKKKKRYYERKGQRITNTHLDGTSVGLYLKAASDKQHKGESIGDGGM